MSSGLDVRHLAAENRYVLARDDEVLGVLAYRSVGRPGYDLVDIYTTQIDPARRGEGLGETLVRGALDDLRSRGTAVRASCWFVADFLAGNPDYLDVAEGADRAVALGNVPDERADPAEAHDAFERGMASTDPSLAGGDPGRPPTG
jgi:hypothetical protein